MSNQSDLVLSRPYLTKSQIQRAQKHTIPDRRAYNQKRMLVFKFLCQLCVQLKLPRKTLEATMYFYHRYHVFNKFETEMCYDIGTSCLFLSCKQVETFKRIGEVCSIALKIRNVPRVTSDVLESFKKRVMQMELRVLEACSFDYRINNEVHIDEFIVKIGRELSFSYEVCRLAWLIAFDVLKLELLITVPPHTISLAVLKLACELLNESKWPNVRYNLFETDSASFHEAYFDILNFYINVFDACNLKDHKAVQKLDLKIETFIEIKKNAGLESGLKTNVLLLDKDDYVSKERNFSVKERRYVLNKECLQEELASNKKRPISELD